MGFWHEIVCDECCTTDDGSNSWKTEVNKRLIEQAKARGWYIGKHNNRTIVYCPECRTKKGK